MNKGREIPHMNIKFILGVSYRLAEAKASS